MLEARAYREWKHEQHQHQRGRGQGQHSAPLPQVAQAWGPGVGAPGQQPLVQKLEIQVYEWVDAMRAARYTSLFLLVTVLVATWGVLLLLTEQGDKRLHISFTN